MWYLHESQIVHGDIKPHNILVDKDLTTVKVCDFGISRIKKRMQQTTTASFISGTYQYMAPETFIDKVKPNFETDIWCAGATIVEIMIMKDLWTVPDEGDLAELLTAKMMKKEEASGLKELKKKHNNIYRKVKGALEYNPKKRVDAKKLWEQF